MSQLQNLTIITTALNASAFLPLYLKNMKPLLDMGCQIIFVDDFSQDDTLKQLAEFEHENFHVEKNSENYGLGKSRNDAIKSLKTQYFTIIDVDDWVDISRFIKSYQYIYNNNYIDCIKVGYIKVKGKKRTPVLPPVSHFYLPLKKEDMVGSRSSNSLVDYPYAPFGFYKTDSIIGKGIFFDELQTCEDRLFCWKIAISNITVQALPYIYYFYLRDNNSNSNTHRNDKGQLDFIKAYKKIQEYVREGGDENCINKLNRQMLAIIEHHINNKERFSNELQKKLFIGCVGLLGNLPEQEKQLLLAEANAKRKELFNTLINYQD